MSDKRKRDEEDGGGFAVFNGAVDGNGNVKRHQREEQQQEPAGEALFLQSGVPFGAKETLLGAKERVSAGLPPTTVSPRHLFSMPPSFPLFATPPPPPFAAMHESAKRERLSRNVAQATIRYTEAIETGHTTMQNAKPIDIGSFIYAHLESALLVNGVDTEVAPINVTHKDGSHINLTVAAFVCSVNSIRCAVDLFDKNRQTIAVDVLRQIEFDMYRTVTTLARHFYSENAGRDELTSSDAQTKEKAEKDRAAIKKQLLEWLFSFKSCDPYGWPEYPIVEDFHEFLRTLDPAYRKQGDWFTKTLCKYARSAVEEQESLERQPYRHRDIYFAVYKFAMLAAGSSPNTQAAMASPVEPQKDIAKSLAFRAVYKFCKAEESTREYKIYRVALVAKDYLAFANRLAPSPVEQWHVDLAMEQRSDAAVDDTLLAALLLCPSSHLVNETLVTAKVTRACSSRIKVASKRIERLAKALGGMEANLCFVRDEAAAKISAALAMHGQAALDLFVDARNAARREFSLASRASSSSATSALVSGSSSSSTTTTTASTAVSYSTAAMSAAVDVAAKGVVVSAEKERAEIARIAQTAAARAKAKTASTAASDALVKLAVTDAGLGDLTCVACLDKPRTICFVPCGDIAMCTGCAAKVSVCPMCRVDVLQKVHFKIP